jgi:hypothetical protein
MTISFPWDSEVPAKAPPPEPLPQAGPLPKPRGRRPRLDPGPGLAALRADSGTAWLYFHLTITGTAGAVDAFAAAACGAGVTPWRLDFGMLEEDIFNMAAAQPPASRNLSTAGCRILARQFRERVERRQGRAAALVGQAQGCPFDLHTLLPVPDAILDLGPTHPDALAWLAAHWGVTDRLRQVTRLQRPKPGRRLPKGFALIGYGFFAAANSGGSSHGGDYNSGESPAVAVATLSARWPVLGFRLQQRPLD